MVLPASVPMSGALAMTIVSRHHRERLQTRNCYLPFLGSGLPDAAGLPGWLLLGLSDLGGGVLPTMGVSFLWTKHETDPSKTLRRAKIVNTRFTVRRPRSGVSILRL